MVSVNSRVHTVNAVIAILAILSLSLALVPSECSSAEYLVQDEDIHVSMSSSSIVVSAGASKTIWFDAKNVSSKDVVVSLERVSAPSGVIVTFPQESRALVTAGNIVSIPVTVSVDVFAHFSSGDVEFGFKIIDPDRGLPINSNTPYILTVEEGGSSSDGYVNRFFGLFDNNLPSPLGESWFAALVTFLTIVSAGFILCFGLLPRVESKMRCRK